MPVIKRYPNRKLYDTEAKQYVTLEGVADLFNCALRNRHSMREILRRPFTHEITVKPPSNSSNYTTIRVNCIRLADAGGQSLAPAHPVK